MTNVTIDGGFARIGAGAWLMSRAQPAAFRTSMRRMRRAGWMLRDRSHLELVETAGDAVCADSRRPFLTHIPCAAQISAVSEKVLVAPSAAWLGAETLRVIPMSASGALCVSTFAISGETQPSQPSSWVVMATASRTTRLVVEDGQSLSVRPDALVAWSGKRPSITMRYTQPFASRPITERG